MKGDPNSVADYTLKLAQQGIATVNELRGWHGLDPIEGGDDFAHANQGPEGNEDTEEDTEETKDNEPKEEDTDAS